MSDAPARSAALTLRGVEKTWASADRRFTFTVDALDLGRGEVVALTGASGSGKSTLLEIVGLACRPDRARRFEMNGTEGRADVAALHHRCDARGLASLRARRIGYVLQTGALLPFLTIAENVALPQRLAGREDPDEAAWLLERLDLGGIGRAYPADVSVGQRQRAAIARAMAHRPQLLLADEPTAALDPPNKVRVIDLFLELAARSRAAVLIATHERALVEGRGLRRLEVDARLVDNAEGNAGAGNVDHVRATLSAA